jgi:hypothetical protein
MLGLAVPVAAVAPTYVFAPIGGWRSDVIVNPATFPIRDHQGAVLALLSRTDAYSISLEDLTSLGLRIAGMLPPEARPGLFRHLRVPWAAARW